MAVGSSGLRYCSSLPITAQSFWCAVFPAHPPRCLDGPFHPAASLNLLRPPITPSLGNGTGISTSCPSTTPFGLALGPDLPWEDDPSPGTLGLSADRILTCLFATYTGILTGARSSKPPGSPSLPAPRSPTTLCRVRSFGLRFSPVTFSAQRHSTSELLRTLSRVAASKPTSWLSGHRHIVSH